MPERDWTKVFLEERQPTIGPQEPENWLEIFGASGTDVEQLPQAPEEVKQQAARDKTMDTLWRFAPAAAMAVAGFVPPASALVGGPIGGLLGGAAWAASPPPREHAGALITGQLGMALLPETRLFQALGPKSLGRIANVVRSSLAAGLSAYTGHKIDQLMKGVPVTVFDAGDGEAVAVYGVAPAAMGLLLGALARGRGKRTIDLAKEVAEATKGPEGKVPPMTLSQATLQPESPGPSSLAAFGEALFVRGSRAEREMAMKQARWGLERALNLADIEELDHLENAIRVISSDLYKRDPELLKAMETLQSLISPEEFTIQTVNQLKKLGRKAAELAGLTGIGSKEAYEIGKQAAMDLYKSLNGRTLSKIVASAIPSGVEANAQRASQLAARVSTLMAVVDDPNVRASIAAGLIEGLVARSTTLAKTGYILRGETFKRILDNFGRENLEAIVGPAKADLLYKLGDIMNRLRPDEVLRPGTPGSSRALSYVASRSIFLMGATGVASGVMGFGQAVSVVVPLSLVVRKILLHGDTVVNLMERAGQSARAAQLLTGILLGSAMDQNPAPEVDRPREPSRVP